MFAALTATVVLAGSLSMPVAYDNPWSANDWAPLKAEYTNCAETAVSTFSYYVCTMRAYTKATTSTVKA